MLLVPLHLPGLESRETRGTHFLSMAESEQHLIRDPCHPSPKVVDRSASVPATRRSALRNFHLSGVGRPRAPAPGIAAPNEVGRAATSAWE